MKSLIFERTVVKFRMSKIKRSQMIIGLSGTPASGKDTVAEYLEKNEGFNHISLSAILREILNNEGIKINLENLTKIGNSLRNECGADFLAKKAKEKIDFKKNLVISSIRQTGEVKFLKNEKDFCLIFVDAEPKVRFERLKKRGRLGDSEDFESFMEIEKKQLQGKEGGMNLLGVKKMADYTITNNETVEKFEKKIQSTMKKIKAQK